MSPQKKISEIKKSITKEELNALPLKAFSGEIQLVTEVNHAVRTFDEVLRQDVIGFDTETRPSFKKNQRFKVALIQLALPDKVFLIRVNNTGVMDEMIHFMESDQVLKVGVGLRDDLKALHSLRSFNPGGFVELSTLAKSYGFEAESVKKLTGLLLGFRISKSAQTSNWEAENYSEKQISYAATDAWVCLEIYRQLTRRPTRS